MKIVTIIGARPQFIKASSLSKKIIELQGSGKDISEVIINTGQHYDKNMNELFFSELQIPKPKYNLNIGGLTHGVMTGRMIEEIEKILINENPECIVVFGDTNSTLAGAIAASKLNIEIAHIESGLRSNNFAMPEELNRIITDRLSSFLFCPSNKAILNLKKEGIDHWCQNPKYYNSGDIMKDCIELYRQYMKKPTNIDLDNNEFILCTIHRAENTNNLLKLNEIFESLRNISKFHYIILPLHPRTKKIIKANNIDYSGIQLIDPVGYLEMIWLLNNSKIVITDSGGLQKEAYFLKKFCITIRSETEWTELVDHKLNIVTDTSKDKIVKALEYFSSTKNSVENFEDNLYGPGRASEIILDKLLERYG